MRGRIAFINESLKSLPEQKGILLECKMLQEKIPQLNILSLISNFGKMGLRHPWPRLSDYQKCHITLLGLTALDFKVHRYFIYWEKPRSIKLFPVPILPIFSLASVGNASQQDFGY